jgi:diaminopimelate decarboxylase
LNRTEPRRRSSEGATLRSASTALRFGHRRATLAFWHKLVTQALRRHATPFYLFSADPIRDALTELERFDRALPVPVRHWLSCKTQPLAPLLQWWRRQGRGIEVVSEFEFLAARTEGFRAENLLVNGPAKHRWLPRHAIAGLSVNFDSPRELDALLPLAQRLGWRVGLRCLTPAESDPENPKWPTQFGFDPAEAVAALHRLQSAKVRLEMIHFHLRTNVESPVVYERALIEVAAICRAARFAPKIVDCGGGWPPPHTRARDGRAFDADFHLAGLAAMYRRALPQFPELQGLWLENGRWLTARSGVLAMRVLDVKERRGLRQLICDGGLTNHALVANWEQHELLTVPARRGPTCLTAVYGPTCMAFDQLACRRLPRAIGPGDVLVWLDAGAYHVPWETRFSHGLTAVLWHEHNALRVARGAEDFASWWKEWRAKTAVRRRSTRGQD